MGGKHHKAGCKADQQYNNAMARAEAALSRLKAAMAAHREAQAAAPGNWGFTGDADWLVEQLNNLTDGLR